MGIDPQDSQPLPRGWIIALPLIFGGLFAAPGVLLICAGLGIVDIFPEFASGPRWVISITGLPFFSMGAWIASRAFEGKAGENSPLSRVARHFLILSFLVPLSGIFLWGGFGPGEREFVTETSSGGVSITRPGNEALGRVIFGGAGICFCVLWVLYIHNLLTRKK